MRTIVIIMILGLAVPALAFDLGPAGPVKQTVNQEPPPADPDVMRQGGDNVLDAADLVIPTVDLVGTTIGYTDYYDEVCPYTNSTSPDVVYTFTPDQSVAINVDMFGSAYDTKIYIYDANLNLVNCNDDFYSDYTSRLENVAVAGGEVYYLVIDGYGGDAGEYLLNVEEFEPCVVECSPWSEDENEPPLAMDYVDLWNGGCDPDPENPMLQPLSGGQFCGVSGWYVSQGGNMRDTDWFLFQVPYSGTFEIVVTAEYQTYLFELGPQDCGNVGVLQMVTCDPCFETVMQVNSPGGEDIWLWVSPTVFASPLGLDVQEYVYTLWIPIGDAVESHTLSDVKDLFR